MTDEKKELLQNPLNNYKQKQPQPQISTPMLHNSMMSSDYGVSSSVGFTLWTRAITILPHKTPSNTPITYHLNHLSQTLIPFFQKLLTQFTFSSVLKLVHY